MRKNEKGIIHIIIRCPSCDGLLINNGKNLLICKKCKKELTLENIYVDLEPS